MANLVGHANVGKSTLCNLLTSPYEAIISSRKQTTDKITYATNNKLSIYDTPGIITNPTEEQQQINRRTWNHLHNYSVNILVMHCKKYKESLDLIDYTSPSIIVLNKIDLLRKTDCVLPIVKEISSYTDKPIIPVSAEKGWNIDSLIQEIEKLPKLKEVLPPLEGAELIKDKVREQVYRSLYQEAPYKTDIKIVDVTTKNSYKHVDIIILVASTSIKNIVLSKIQGIRSKTENILNKILQDKTYLHLRVKVDFNHFR